MTDVVVTDARERERARQRHWREQNPEKARAKQARWEQQHPGASAEKTRRYRSNHPDRVQQASQAEKKRHPGRRQAYKIVAKALEAGRIIKPTTCEICHQEKRVQAHHEDYMRPLDIQWVCVSCHKLHHLTQPAQLDAGSTKADWRQRGETHYNAKLTTSQVQAIREQFAAGGVSKAALARRYGVTDVLIGIIIRGKGWKHV